jgi:hypothetical protein
MLLVLRILVLRGWETRVLGARVAAIASLRSGNFEVLGLGLPS